MTIRCIRDAIVLFGVRMKYSSKPMNELEMFRSRHRPRLENTWVRRCLSNANPVHGSGLEVGSEDAQSNCQDVCHRLLTGLNRLPNAAGVPPYHWCVGFTRKCLLEFGHVRKRAIDAVSVRCVGIGCRLQPLRFRTI